MDKITYGIGRKLSTTVHGLTGNRFGKSDGHCVSNPSPDIFLAPEYAKVVWN